MNCSIMWRQYVIKLLYLTFCDHLLPRLLLSELTGEETQVQPVSNISTAADLLKQGAGELILHACV